MVNPSKKLIGAYGNPGFSLVIALAYYDGPEYGIGIFPDGTAMQIQALADSPSRLYRAFEFTRLGGTWWGSARNALEDSLAVIECALRVPSADSPRLVALEREMKDAVCDDYWVGVGEPNLSALRLAKISIQDLRQLRLKGAGAEGFRTVHSYIKREQGNGIWLR